MVYRRNENAIVSVKQVVHWYRAWFPNLRVTTPVGVLKHLSWGRELVGKYLKICLALMKIVNITYPASVLQEMTD